MPRPSLSLSKSMAVVALAAADFAALRSFLPIMPNPGMVVMVLILEVGLFLVVARRGASRAFWVAFEVAGWVYVLAHWTWALPIWKWSRSVYEARVVGRPITVSNDGFRMILAAGAFQLTLCLLASLACGLAARAVSRRWSGARISSRPGPPAPGGA